MSFAEQVTDAGIAHVRRVISAETLQRLRQVFEKTPHGMLSRGVAGAIGPALVVNLPGSPRAVRESLEVLVPVLPHAVELLAGESGEQTHRSRGASPPRTPQDS